jgi:hypothetical protein
MNEDMSSRYARKAPIRTLGGRLVLGEPAKVVKGKKLAKNIKLAKHLCSQVLCHKHRQIQIMKVFNSIAEQKLIPLLDFCIVNHIILPYVAFEDE